MRVSIVIPYWNGAEKIKKHLKSVIEIAKINGIEEIIACDDASTDETVALLKNEFPEIILVERKVNGGFSSNVNDGVAKATGDLILLLNSDADLIEGFLEYALPHFKNSDIFSVGFNTGGSYAFANFKNGYFWHHQADIKITDLTKSHQTLWVSGGGGIFRKSIWDKMGGLDTLMDPFYGEDMDLGYRATKRGYINIWEPRSKIKHYHEPGVISQNFALSKITDTAERNILVLIWKNITDPKMIHDHKIALVKRLLKHPKYWPIFLSALKRYPEVMRKRKIEKRESKLTDQEVFSIFDKKLS